MLAAMNGHTAAVKLLLDMGSDINAQVGILKTAIRNILNLITVLLSSSYYCIKSMQLLIYQVSDSKALHKPFIRTSLAFHILTITSDSAWVVETKLCRNEVLFKKKYFMTS